MKVCPNCQNTFDDAQNFCLNDGTPLVTAAATDIEPATVVTGREIPVPPPSNFGQPTFVQPSQVQPQIVQPSVVAAAPRKSNTGLIVALTALTTLLLIGVLGGGYWLLTRDRQIAATNTNSTAQLPKNSNVAANSSNANSNANSVSNANLSTPLSSPSPTMNPAQSATVKKEVTGAIDGWAAATEDADIDSHMNYYAGQVDYYKAGAVSANRIREDRQKAFGMYDSLTVSLSNVRVTPDVSGNKATVILDKEWDFDSDEKYSRGKVQQQLTLQKIGKQWVITGEKDLQLYYKDAN
jgi:hypothetical protein